jgi:predicted porin
VAAAVDELRGGPGAFGGLVRSGLTDRRSTVTGWFKWRDVKFGAGVIARRNEGSAFPSSTLQYVGAAWSSLPRWQLEGQVFRWDVKGNADRATLVALRATYFLSKRTAIYATGGTIDNDGRAAVSVSNGAPGGGPSAGRAQSGLAAGMRHLF